MLKLIYTPTNEITDRDLVPGSWWRRVRDENGPLKEPYECVLIQHDRYWAIYRDWVACCAVGVCSGTLHNADEMLTWLRRDFERVGEKKCGELKKLRDVPRNNAFAQGGKMYVILSLFEEFEPNDAYMCRSIGEPTEFKTSVLLEHTVRDLGPIEIDDSVKGVG